MRRKDTPFAWCSFHTLSFHTLSFHTLSFHTLSFHTLSFHTLSFHTLSFHTLSFHTLSLSQNLLVEIVEAAKIRILGAGEGPRGGARQSVGVAPDLAAAVGALLHSLVHVAEPQRVDEAPRHGLVEKNADVGGRSSFAPLASAAEISKVRGDAAVRILSLAGLEAETIEILRHERDGEWRCRGEGRVSVESGW
jgi:hypothetical protein